MRIHVLIFTLDFDQFKKYFLIFIKTECKDYFKQTKTLS